MPHAYRPLATRAPLLAVCLLLLSATVANATKSPHLRRAPSCATGTTATRSGWNQRAARKSSSCRRSCRSGKIVPSNGSERSAAHKSSSSQRRAKHSPAAVKRSERPRTALSPRVSTPAGRRLGSACPVRPSDAATGASESGSVPGVSGSGAATGTSAEPPGPEKGASEESTPVEGGSEESAPFRSAPFRFFASTSFWNAPVPANAPLDASSTSVVDALAEKVAAGERAGQGPWIDTTSWSIPVYTVPANQPMVPVQLEGNPHDTLAAAFSEVPLPPDAQAAGGSDKELALWQPSTGRLWEFWRLTRENNGWQASWGGAMQHAQAQQGVYGPEVWPGAEPWWGMSGSSLSTVAGLISLEDLKLGKINHALTIGVGETRAGVYASPAQRTDGRSEDPLSLPEGAHLRLDPNVDLSALHLPRLTLMIAEAAQHYGVFVADSGSSVGFSAQDPTPTGTEPYGGPSGYFEGKSPDELLASFPWQDLQLLKMELHTAT